MMDEATRRIPVTFLLPHSSDQATEIEIDRLALAMAFVGREGFSSLGERWDEGGVYFLLGSGSEAGTFAVYVGKAPQGLRARLRTHRSDKDKAWFTSALLIRRDTSAGFGSGVAGWLEQRLWDQLRSSERAELRNDRPPKDETEPGWRRDDAEAFVPPILAVLRVLGFVPDTPDQLETQAKPRKRYSQSVSDLIESGLLKVGSTLTPIPQSHDTPAEVLPDGQLRVGNEQFASVSAAAGTVTNGSVNGWDFWGAPSGDGTLVSIGKLRGRLDEGQPAVGAVEKGGSDAGGGIANEDVERRMAVKNQESAAQSWATPTEELNAMYAAGLIHDSLHATYKGKQWQAELTAQGQISLSDGSLLASLSAAAGHVTGGSTNGWDFWKVREDGQSVRLSAIRDRFRKMQVEGTIASDELSIEEMPPVDADWSEVSRFALKFNGYVAKGGDAELLSFGDAALAQWTRSNVLPSSLDDLRSALFCEQRYTKWNSMDGPREPLYVRDLIKAIRAGVSERTSG